MYIFSVFRVKEIIVLGLIVSSLDDIENTIDKSKIE